MPIDVKKVMLKALEATVEPLSPGGDCGLTVDTFNQVCAAIKLAEQTDPTNKIELLLATEDGTWTTEILDIPAEIDREDANSVREWTMEKLWGQVQYREIIFFGVYNTEPEADGDDPRLTDHPDYDQRDPSTGVGMDDKG